ncbi:MAG: ferritin family protein [Calditrichaeota bacterium]|nr:ferritin family protein [Calditrichota bacterium]
MGQQMTIMDAINLAMEAEKKAQQFYAESAAKVASERGRDLLTQLANFEQSHYDALAELRSSLTSSGTFTTYQGTSFAPYRPKAEVEGKIEPNKEDALSILQMAIEAETQAYERYRSLATRTDDPQGKAMFQKLAEEEILHRRILNDEFYYLNNRGGIWFWGD